MLKALLTLFLSSSLISETSGHYIQNNWNTQNTGSNSSASILNITLPPSRIGDKDDLPQIQAAAALAMDLKSGKILYQKNIDGKRAIASITKLMTAIIVLEENELSEVATIAGSSTEVGGVMIWLFPGEKITIENLLKGALISSGNDAAHALALHNGGSIEYFVKKMNQKAKLLGLENTSFANPMGFDHENNYSTARDLAILTTYALQKQFIRDAVQVTKTEVYDVTGKIKHSLESTNQLLSDEFLKVKGVKTGHTEMAGLCLISLIESAGGHEFITIVLDSPARFTETKALASWVMEHYIWP